MVKWKKLNKKVAGVLLGVMVLFSASTTAFAYVDPSAETANTEAAQTETVQNLSLIHIFQPGCKFEIMLCLVGGQGAGKSTFFRLLAVRDEWFSDDLRKLCLLYTSMMTVCFFTVSHKGSISEKGLLLFFCQNEVVKRHPIHQA